VDEPPEEATKEEADEGTPPVLGDESPFESEKIAPLEEEPAFEEEGPPPLPDTEASVEDEAVEEFLPPAPGDEVGDKDEDFDEDFGKELFGGFPKPEERAEKDTPAPFPDEPADAPSLEKEPTSLEEEPTSEESFSEDRLFPVDESESLEEADEPQSAAFDDERPGDSAAPPLSDDESARDEAEGMGEETEAASGDFPELETLQDDASFGGDEPLSDIRQRLSAEPPELDVSSLDFTEHLRTTLDELEPAARRKGLMMHRALPSRELSIETDAGALRLLVAALVNNAITSTDEGSITVSEREEDDEALRLRVVDTGADISKSLLNSLLNIQIAEGEDDDEESQEQHMKFVHRLVNLMQGSVEMESQRGRGTVFTVTLPRHADRLSSGETADALPSGAAAAPENSSSPATPSSGDGADAWSGWGGSEWNAPEEASPEETASEESAYDESATSPEAPEHDQAPSTDSDEPAPPARDGSDSIFSTSPESDEDAEDDPDAFRSNPDSPFSF
jgi:two-component sensor histidine kinase